MILDKITCQNCKHEEKLEKVNYRKDSKIFLANLYLRQKNSEQEIYTFICFSCNHLTNCTPGLEYLETYKYDCTDNFVNYFDIYGYKNQFENLKKHVDNYNSTGSDYDGQFDHVVEKFNNIKK